MGILVWSEIPCYWTIDWTNPSTYANAERQLTDMISRDQSRANVIIWSIANGHPTPLRSTRPVLEPPGPSRPQSRRQSSDFYGDGGDVSIEL